MVNQELLEEYSSSIKRLKKQCLDAGLTEDEFRQLYFESLKTLEKENEVRSTQAFYSKHKHLFVVVLFTLLVAYNFKSIYSNLICNLQEYLYPGLKLLRKMSIPLISLFPSLTDFYYETCLIQNPFFTVVDMDCWPCSTVNNVREIHDPKPNGQHNAPFVYETEQKPVKIEHLKEMYIKHKKVFDKESPKISANNKYHFTPEEFFNKESTAGDKNYYIWRFNNMNIARLLRQIIPRPKVVPKFGQSTERFIIVDSSQESIRVPDTECSFSFLLSLSGTRVVHLHAAEECKHQCKSLKVELKDSYLLWYNWWYWRPVVQPSAGNTTFIAHTEQKPVKIEHLKEMYIKHKKVFDKESPKISANNKYHFTPEEFFNKESTAGDKNYYIWRFNNMNIARLLRQIIPRPKVVPKFGQSTERFIIVDSSQESIRIPDTECSFSFLLSLSGTRVIHLHAAEECKHQCKSLKVELKDSYLLWYNWWYWRPVIQPSAGNTTFIAHVGSYC